MLTAVTFWESFRNSLLGTSVTCSSSWLFIKHLFHNEIFLIILHEHILSIIFLETWRMFSGYSITRYKKSQIENCCLKQFYLWRYTRRQKYTLNLFTYKEKKISFNTQFMLTIKQRNNNTFRDVRMCLWWVKIFLCIPKEEQKSIFLPSCSLNERLLHRIAIAKWESRLSNNSPIIIIILAVMT